MDWCAIPTPPLLWMMGLNVSSFLNVTTVPAFTNSESRFGYGQWAALPRTIGITNSLATVIAVAAPCGWEPMVAPIEIARPVGAGPPFVGMAIVTFAVV